MSRRRSLHVSPHALLHIPICTARLRQAPIPQSRGPSSRVACGLVHACAHDGAPRVLALSLSVCVQVWMEELDASDMRLIATNHFPAIPATLLERMIGFARALQREVVTLRKFGSRGAPWDFNLRDLFRWCELIELEQVRAGKGSRLGPNLCSTHCSCDPCRRRRRRRRRCLLRMTKHKLPA